MKITPNQITIARIIALPFGIWALYQSGTIWQLISWLIFFVIAMSDVVDGRLARSSGQITEMGKFLDPVADKLMLASVMIPLSHKIAFRGGRQLQFSFANLALRYLERS